MMEDRDNPVDEVDEVGGGRGQLDFVGVDQLQLNLSSCVDETKGIRAACEA